MKKINKNQRKKIVLIVVVIVIIIAIVIATKTRKNNNKKHPQVYNDSGMLQFESEIDMSDTSNSEIREDGMKINTSEKIKNGIEFNDVLIKDITIESTGDMAVFNASVENNLEKDLEECIIYLIFLDNKGKEIAKVETLFPNIPNGETGYISATTPKDIATAYDIKVEQKVE